MIFGLYYKKMYLQNDIHLCGTDTLKWRRVWNMSVSNTHVW